MALFILVVGVIFLAFVTPVFSPDEIRTNVKIQAAYKATGQFRWEDGKEHSLPQDYADMIGWKDMAGLVDKVRNELRQEEWEHTLVICDNYGQADAINYYAEEYPSAVSMNADYRDWFPGKEKIIRNVLLIQGKGKPDPGSFSAFFASIDSVGVVGNELAREYGTTLFLLRDAVNPWNGESFLKWLTD